MTSKPKLVCAFIMAVAIGYFTYMTIMLYLSGQSFTIGSFIAYITTSTTAGINGLVTFVTEKLTLIIGAIGGTVTLAGTAYKLVSNKISDVKQTGQNQLESAQNQIGELSSLVDEQEQIIKEQKATIDAQKDLQSDYDTLETQFKQVNEQNRTQQSTINTYERMGNIDYVKKLQESLRLNNIPIPPYEGTTVTVVK